MLVYLDNSATTHPCEAAVTAAMQSMQEGFYNPSSAYAASIPVQREMDRCRAALLSAFGAQGGRIVFTSGGTESDNLAIGGAMRRRSMQSAICTAVEHPAVLHCARVYGAQEIPVGPEGTPDLDRFESAVRSAQGLGVVSAMLVNNETGAIFPVQEMARIVKEHSSALFHCDAVQGFLHVDMPDLRRIDLLSISGHKIHAPKGIGALYIAEGVQPGQVSFGGGQENGLRSGTENTPGIAGLRAALEQDGGAEARARMMQLKLRLHDGIMQIYPNAQINGPAPETAAPHILNVSFAGILGEVLLHALEGDGIYVSTGSACAARQNHPSHVLTAMGLGKARVQSAIRFSLSQYTTQDEIDYTLEALKKHLPALARFKRR